VKKTAMLRPMAAQDKPRLRFSSARLQAGNGRAKSRFFDTIAQTHHG
jgi:hypothetical protein